MQWNLFLLGLIGQSCLGMSQLYEYHYVEDNKSWTEAQQFCRNTYTDLATVSNMTDVKRIIDDVGNKTTEAWIGLRDGTDGTRMWHWSLPGLEYNTSEANWAPGEPNDGGSEHIENCGFRRKQFNWGDTSCNDQYYFLCYNESDPSKLHLIKEKKKWLEAQSYCRENHTDLISGLNQLISGMNQLKEQELSSTLSDNEVIFIGLFRDTWMWSDGSSFSFRHWNLKFNIQLNNTGQCAMTLFNDRGRWKNEDCNTRKPFICYSDKVILITENKTWEQALYYCRVHHHDLVAITSLDEQRWVQEKIKKASTPFVWTGLRYTCTLDFWFWVSDEVVSYKNWVSGGPMDECDMSGAMETEGRYKWLKKKDSEEYNFICAKS